MAFVTGRCNLQVKGVDSSDIVEKEAKRLEVVKRRQERELAQMVQYELMRKELQALFLDRSLPSSRHSTVNTFVGLMRLLAPDTTSRLQKYTYCAPAQLIIS